MGRKRFSIICMTLFVLFLQFSTVVYAEVISDPAEGWEELWSEMLIDITAIGVVFALIAAFLLFTYRRQRPGESGKGTALSPLAAFGWVVIPLFVFMADDIYLAAENFEHWAVIRNVPKNALVVEVEGYMWAWDFKYPEGIKTTNELRVPAGKPIHLKLTSRDVIHSLFLPDFRTKWDAVPGRENYLWFHPKKPGEHVLTCTEFCGMLHSSMSGKVIVMPEAEFNKWVEEKKEEIKKEAQNERSS